MPFPTANDSLTNPTGTDQLSSPSHADQHADANDAIEAMQLVMSTSPVGAVVFNSGAQSVANITSVAITFGAETYDPYGFHSTSVNTSRLTVPAGLGGVYLVAAQLSYAANATGIRYLIIYKNGLPVVQHQSAAASGDRTHVMIAWPLELAAGDYIEVYARHDSGGALNVGHTNVELVNKLSMFRL